MNAQLIYAIAALVTAAGTVLGLVLHSKGTILPHKDNGNDNPAH